MDQQVIDRRSDARIEPPADGSTGATLRPGCSVRVVDLSPGGALVQAARPLRPGARVHVQLVTSARTFTVTARVLRCAVWTLDPHDGATYRGALQFENRCEWLAESDTRVGSTVPAPLAAEALLPGHALPDAEDASRGRGRKHAK